MIRSFKCKKTEKLFADMDISKFRSFERQARRRLLYLNQAVSLGDLRAPPSNKMEALKGDRKGQYSIRINQQWRLCFRWHDGHVFDVEIVDYH